MLTLGTRPVSVSGRLALCLIGIVLLVAARSEGQGRFRITHGPGTRQDSSLRITGQVFNDGDRNAVDVWVTAQALDGGGKVLARGITFVSQMIPGRGSAAFIAKVPFVEGVETWRVTVSSYRDGAVTQSP